MTHDTITCDALDERLADYLEGALGAADSAAVEAHAASCTRCRALLADLRAITGGAAALPEMHPPRDLWDGIAARIDAPVVPLDAARVQRGRRVAPRRLPVAWLGAAAAALVLATAGVTYELTMRQAGQTVAVQPDFPRLGGDSTAVGGGPTAPVPVETARTESAEAGSQAQLAGNDPARAARPSAVPNASALPPAFQMYDREIGRLRAVVAQRRGELDPKTVAVIEQNLRLIDMAIRESRAALARDPESGFLHQQLNDALDKKVELLRTVALLPARS